MPFSIHQFSSGINNPTKNRNGEWVSGGFGGEIANESFVPVPEEIRKAVETKEYSGWRGFGIPDAYAPKPGEIALIARDLGRYCVLAVANLQKDEGQRPFIAYRYFWLDKRQFQYHSTPQDVDGIGTLLWCWQQKRQPQYNIRELQTNRSSYTTSWDNLQQVWLFEHWQPQHLIRIQPLLSDIPLSQQPLIYEAAEISGKLTWQEVHCLAIKYGDVNNCDINWAWNVRKLENTQGLNVIYCADAEALRGFNSQFPSPVPALPPAATPSLQEGMTKTFNSRRDASVNSSLKECLKIFRDAKFTEQDILNLINYYQNYDEDKIFESADQQEINKFIGESSPQEFAIKYATLLTALTPNKTQVILENLIKLNPQKKRVAIQFLADLKQTANDSSCRQHEFFMSFYYALTQLQDKLTKSLEPNSSIFDPYLNLLPHQIRDFLTLIFFLLFLGGTVGLIHWQKPDILSRLPWLLYQNYSENPKKNDSHPANNADNFRTKFALLLNRYETLFNQVEIAKKNQLDRSESFQSLSTALQESGAEIRKILDDNQQLLTELKDQNPQVVQEARQREMARQREIYKQLKLFTPLNSTETEKALPSLQEESNDYLSVTMLQEALKRGGYYLTGQEDRDLEGIFGEATKNAVIQAQTKAGFEQNDIVGRVGRKTWGEIFKDVIQDLQVEAVYQTLQTHLTQDNPTSNIVTEIKNCRDQHNKEKTPLHFNDCLEKIVTPTTQVNEATDSGQQNTQTTQD